MIETFLETKRGQLPSDFDYISCVMPEHVINSSRTDFISWYTARYRLTMDDALRYVQGKVKALLYEVLLQKKY